MAHGPLVKKKVTYWPERVVDGLFIDVINFPNALRLYSYEKLL